MAVAAPADRRFRRSHVKPARRRRAWAGRGWQLARVSAAVAVALYGVYRGAALVLSAEALHVTRITVTGNVRLSKGEVIALLDGARGQSMVTLDLERWRQRLLSSPWVETASMRRVLPGTITVQITERQPMGIGRLGDRLYLVDRTGTIIDEFGPNYADVDLPIVDGLASNPRDGAPLIDEARAALAARLLASLETRPDLAKRVSQVDVSDPRDGVVVLKSDPALLRLGDDAFVERLQGYLDLAPALRERVEQIDYVDLRFDDRVYVRPVATKGIKAQPSPRGRGRGVRSEPERPRRSTPRPRRAQRGSRGRGD
jgi:cell division septal protein FtsQ